MTFLMVENGVVNIFFSQKRLRGSLKEFREGKVFDASDGKSEVVRAWRVGSEIHVAHQFSHDRAWPHDIIVFPLPDGDCGITKPTKALNLHEYLAQGGGIPAKQ
jgi:hypothetical protein